MEAARRWRLAALRRGWHGPGVEAAYSDVVEEIAEAAEAMEWERADTRSRATGLSGGKREGA